MTRLWIWILFVALFGTACGCSGSRPAPVAVGPHLEAESPAGEPQAAAPAQPRRHSKADSRSAGAADVEESAEPAPFRRPGLATRWGEERDSRITEVSFARDSSQPFGMVAINYDDENGIRSATGQDLDFAYAGVFPVSGGALTVSVVDSGGDPLPGLQANGRGYIFGDHGDRYMIRITNHTPGRFEVVTTVDGLDVIDGQDGSPNKRGYIVAPWGTLDIEGFRDSYESVRTFRFGSVEDSYAARRGKGQNIGVIGVALFAERGFYHRRHGEVHRRDNADPFPGRFAPPPNY